MNSQFVAPFQGPTLAIVFTNKLVTHTVAGKHGGLRSRHGFRCLGLHREA